MSRMTAITCLILSLLCPFLCAAETAEECTTHGQTCGNVCEAMAVGAIVNRASDGPIAVLDHAPSFERQIPPGLLDRGFAFRVSPIGGADKRARWPGPEPRRCALLQAFLF